MTDFRSQPSSQPATPRASLTQPFKEHSSQALRPRSSRLLLAALTFLTFSFLPPTHAQNAANGAATVAPSSTRLTNDKPAATPRATPTPAATPKVATAPAGTLPAPAASAAPDATSNPAATAGETSAAASAAPPIVININGQATEANPAPVMQNGSVLVPLRGVLENLGASVSYNAATRGILITQGARRVVLVMDSRDATADGKAVVLTAAPQLIGGSAFVPLRSLAQLFGYSVQWIPATSTVAITGATGETLPTANHREALKAAGRLGVGISFVEGEGVVSDAEADRLLDAAREAGASLIKVRFDWGVLEPTKGAQFQWTFYDRVVAEARRRGLTIEGVLGQSAKWASTFYKSTDPEQWRNGAPRTSETTSWRNYVKSVVGRYKNDVQAWQVWEKTSADRFRSSQTVYRKFLFAAVEAARASDPKAILFAAEPGGLDLDVIESLSRSQAAPFLDGVAVYPASQNQPGSAVPPGEFLRPYSSLVSDPNFRGSTQRPLRDFWIGGLSRPVLGEGATDAAGASAEMATKDEDTRARLLRTFTSQAQADYLLQSSTLALAAGSDKVFWSDLRDRDVYESIAPINAEYNSGLLRRDFEPRPAFNAFKTLSQQVQGKKYIGSLALGPDIVALVFDDGKDASVVAWTTGANVQLIVNPSGENPGVPNSLYISSAAQTQVLDSVGNTLGGSQFVDVLTRRPVWITHIAYETRLSIRKPNPRGVLLDPRAPTFVAAQGVSANFGMAGNESGLYWRKFSQFRGAANEIVKVNVGSGLTTEVSRNVLDPAAGKFFIFLDVDDDYLYLTRDVPVEVTVVVQRPAPDSQTLVTATAGFNIEYSTPTGTGRTAWQNVEAGSGWATYTFTLPDASFANRGGYDLVINTFGSKKNLVFSSVSILRK